jgi:hypothetical protein
MVERAQPHEAPALTASASRDVEDLDRRFSEKRARTAADGVSEPQGTKGKSMHEPAQRVAEERVFSNISNIEQSSSETLWR